jgi:hypothetical protein
MNYTNFQDFVSIVPIQVPKEIKNKYIDRVIKDIDRQKEDGADEIQGLQVKLRATHAARLTGHFHLYAPAKVRSGADTFTEPFKKPILINHDEDGDPIGRIQKATYIATPHPLIPASIFEDSQTNRDHTPKSLAWVDKISRFISDRSFEGLGYLSLLGNITDPEAIVKVLDGRYLTVSVGYDTNSLHCSICKQDWLKDGPCEHEKGQMYKDKRMFFIFGDLTYGEVSYVNIPADEFAQNEEVKKVLIPMATLKDSLKSIRSKTKKADLIKDAFKKDSYLQDDPSRIIATVPSFYLYDSVGKDIVPIFSDSALENNLGDKMKIKELLALDTDGVYAELTALLPEDKVLKSEELKQLKDEDFVGNRQFPVLDQDHINACKSLFEKYEDSEEKTQMLEYMDTREIALANKTAETTEPVIEVKTDSNGETSNTLAAETTDYLTYEFKFEAGNWGIPDPDSQSTEKEKQILELLLSLYSQDKMDALHIINKVLETAKDSKDEIINELAERDSKTQEVAAEKETLKKEFNVVKDALVSSNSVINSLTRELKDSYVDEILRFTDNKIDPDNSAEQKREFFKDKSLSEVKTSLEVLRMVDGKTSTHQTIIEDPTLKHDSTKMEGSDDKQIEELKKQIEREYTFYRSTLGQDVAERRRMDQLATLQRHIDKNSKKPTEAK